MTTTYKPLLISGVIAASFFLLGVVSPSDTQCPYDYTQTQIDATDCTVGAYIGIPPTYDYIIAGFVLAAGSLFTLVRLKRTSKVT
jgi:hypothetical protein